MSDKPTLFVRVTVRVKIIIMPTPSWASNMWVFFFFFPILGYPWNKGISVPKGRWGLRWLKKPTPHEELISGAVWICPKKFCFAEACKVWCVCVCVHLCPGSISLYRAESCLPPLKLFLSPWAFGIGSRSLFHVTVLQITGEGHGVRFPLTPRCPPTPCLSLSFLRSLERCFYSQLPGEISWFLDSCWVCPDVPIFVLYDIN